EEVLHRLGLAMVTWRPWAALWVLIGLVALLASWLVRPVVGTEQLYLGDLPFGTGCEYRREHGHGCVNCVMTRAWGGAARGQRATAWSYTSAGASLFSWLVAGGALSAARLAVGGRVLRFPWWLSLGVALVWTALWLGVYALRTQGFLPLPADH